jgi:lipid-A-disaccharide synthase-like uncharacterized protein
MIEKIMQYFQFDFWVFWGLAAQGFFFLRLVIQWLRSEKEKKTIIPLSFWWLGIAGAIMLLVYAIARRDIVFLLTSVLQLVIYYRNFIIGIKSKDQNPLE